MGGAGGRLTQPRLAVEQIPPLAAGRTLATRAGSWCEVLERARTPASTAAAASRRAGDDDHSLVPHGTKIARGLESGLTRAWVAGSAAVDGGVTLVT